MNSNGILQKHWLNVTFHFVIDALLFSLAFLIGTELRLGNSGLEKQLFDYLPSILWTAVVFPCVIYIFGL